MSSDDADLEELRRKREERRKLQEEEEKRESEERARKEDERKQRKLEREKKSKEREDAHAKELEASHQRNAKEDERKKKREERERQRLEEERLEKEAEEKKAKEREDKRREEQAAEELKKKKELEARKKDEPGTASYKREGSVDTRSDWKKSKVEKLLDIIKAGQPDAMDKIVVDEDMKEECTKLISEENELVCEFFNKPATVMSLLKYISTVLTDPRKHTDDQLEDIMGRMEFSKDAITGAIPSLWRTILQNKSYLEELFALLKNDVSLLPPINVTCFWKSVEFLLYRRGYEISNFMLSNKEVIPSFFKHLRDTNLMDVLNKLVEKEAASTPTFKEYDAKKAATLPEAETAVWTDAIPTNIIAAISKGSRGEDDEWSDVEVDSVSQFSVLILEKFAESKLAVQLRDPAFVGALISAIFDPFATSMSSGAATNGVATKSPRMVKFRHQSTVVSLLSYIIHLLKFCVNTSAYTTTTIPPLIACLIYGAGGKGSNSKVIPVNIVKQWIDNNIPQFEFPVEHLNPKKGLRTVGLMRVRCVQLLRALFVTNFQCVDESLRDNGALKSCVELFFQNVDNNIVHNLVGEIVKVFFIREANTPLPLEASTAMHPHTPFTIYLLDDCDLVERLVGTLRAIALNKNSFSAFNTSRLEIDDLTVSKSNPAAPQVTAKPVASASAKNIKRREEKLTRDPNKDRPFLPPAFVGHVLDICKAITLSCDKSVKIRHVVASCSGYHWGQTVMFHLGMRDSADMEWKKPFKKPVPQDKDAPATKSEGERDRLD